jgi:hypothetical protein
VVYTVIPAKLDAQIGELWSKADFRQKAQNPFWKITTIERAGGVAQMEGHMPSKQEVLSSNCSTANKIKHIVYLDIT